MIVTIVTHELGHVIVAQLCRWKCSYLLLFGVRVHLHNGFRFERVPQNNLLSFGGAAAIIPPQSKEGLARHYSYILLGGAIANLVLFALLAGFGLFINLNDLLVLSAMPLLNAIVAILPIKYKYFSTDGKKIANLMKGGDVMREEIIRLYIGASLESDSIPVFTDSDLSVLTSSSDPVSQYYGYLYSIFMAKKRGDCEACEQLIAQLGRVKLDKQYAQQIDSLFSE